MKRKQAKSLDLILNKFTATRHQVTVNDKVYSPEIGLQKSKEISGL